MCNISNEPEYFFSPKQAVKLAKKLNVVDVVSRAIDQLYNDRKIDSATQKQLHAITYAPLKQAVEEGFGKPLFKVEYGTPNYEMLKNLQYNASVFAMFKSHAQAKEMAAKLKDESGNLRNREDFKREAWKVDSKYREQYLNTEYDTAVRCSRMAAIWAKTLQTERLYPNLKYLPSRSAIQREEHKQFYGLVLPIRDPFWRKYYPPNGWGCKCGVEPSDDDVTDVPDKLAEPEKGFDFNSGMTGEVFDLQNSAYIKSVPPAQQPALIRDAKKVVDAEAAENTPYVKLFSTKNGGSVEASPLAFNTQDYNKNVAAARLMANDGHQVRLLPEITDEALRPKLLPVAEMRPKKNPDILVNDDFVADMKVLEKSSKRVVAHALDEAREQCNNAVLIIPDSITLTKEEIIEQIKKKCRFKEMQDFGNIWVNYKGNWLYNPQDKK